MGKTKQRSHKSNEMIRGWKDLQEKMKRDKYMYLSCAGAAMEGCYYYPKGTVPRDVPRKGKGVFILLQGLVTQCDRRNSET